VVVEFLLPQAVACLLLELKRGFLFEALQEAKQVAGWLHSFDEQVHMVRHEAVGVNGERMRRRLLTKEFEKPATGHEVFEDRATPPTAESDKEPATSAVTLRDQTNVLPREFQLRGTSLQKDSLTG